MSRTETLGNVELTLEELELVRVVLDDPGGGYEAWQRQLSIGLHGTKKRTRGLANKIAPHKKPKEEVTRWCRQNEPALKDLLRKVGFLPAESNEDLLLESVLAESSVRRHRRSLPDNDEIIDLLVGSERPKSLLEVLGESRITSAIRAFKGRRLALLLREINRNVSALKRSRLLSQWRPALWERIHADDSDSGLAAFFLLDLTQTSEHIEPDIDTFSQALTIADLSTYPFSETSEFWQYTRPEYRDVIVKRLISLMQPVDGNLAPEFADWLRQSYRVDTSTGYNFNFSAGSYFVELQYSRELLVKFWKWISCQSNCSFEHWLWFIERLEHALGVEPPKRTPEADPKLFPGAAWKGLVIDLQSLFVQSFEGRRRAPSFEGNRERRFWAEAVLPMLVRHEPANWKSLAALILRSLFEDHVYGADSQQQPRYLDVAWQIADGDLSSRLLTRAILDLKRNEDQALSPQFLSDFEALYDELMSSLPATSTSAPPRLLDEAPELIARWRRLLRERALFDDS